MSYVASRPPSEIDVRALGARPGDSDSSAAFQSSVVAAIDSGCKTVYVPAGLFRFTQTLVMPPGMRMRAESPYATVLDFRVDPGTDGLVWQGPEQPGIYDVGGFLDGVTLLSSSATARDLLVLRKVARFDASRCIVRAPQRNALRVDECIDVDLHRLDLTGAMAEGQLYGITGLYVPSSTAVTARKCYIHNFPEGPGADVEQTNFYDCTIESNGSNYAYNAHGAQDPMLGAGIRVRKGWTLISQGHFENNAGHAIILGTEARTLATVLGPNIAGDVTNYTQPTAAGIWADRVEGGTFLGIGLEMPRSVVFTENSRNVALLGMLPLVGSFVNPPEYLGNRWDETPADIRYYRGLVQFQDPNTGALCLVGGNVTSPGCAVGDLALLAPNPAGDLLPAKIFLSQAYDNPGAGTIQSLGLSTDKSRLELIGVPLHVEKGVGIGQGLSASPPPGRLESDGVYLYWTDASGLRHQLGFET